MLVGQPGVGDRRPAAQLGRRSSADLVQPRVDLGVDPAWRRRGIGSRLLLEVARVARSSDADEIVVKTAGDKGARGR